MEGIRNRNVPEAESERYEGGRMKVYDRFIDEYIDEEDIDPIAPPERYVKITEDMLIENATRWLSDARKDEMNEAKSLRSCQEVYSLRLDHYILDDDYERHSLSEPIVVNYVIDRRFWASPTCINDMLDMMRDKILQKMTGKE